MLGSSSSIEWTMIKWCFDSQWDLQDPYRVSMLICVYLAKHYSFCISMIVGNSTYSISPINHSRLSTITFPFVNKTTTNKKSTFQRKSMGILRQIMGCCTSTCWHLVSEQDTWVLALCTLGQKRQRFGNPAELGSNPVIPPCESANPYNGYIINSCFWFP